MRVREVLIIPKLRIANETDLAGILAVHMGAFGGEGAEIAELVSALLCDETAAPVLSLVAQDDGQIIGHVLFTAVRLAGANREVSAQILAPLGVLPEHQGKGIGGALIREGLQRLAASGVELVFVLGHPDYYPKFGFAPAMALGLVAPYPILPANEPAWMVQELRSGVIGHVHGQVQCADTLNDPRHWQE